MHEWLSPTSELKGALLSGGGWLLAAAVVASAFGLSMAVQTLGAAICLGPVRKSKIESWAEKARLVYPVWIGLTGGLLLLGFLSILQVQIFTTHISFAGAGSLSSICPIVSFLAGGVVAAQVESEVKGRKVRLRDVLGQLVILLLIFLPHFVVICWLTPSVPDRFTPRVWLYVMAGGLAITFYLFSGGLFLGRLFGLTVGATERLKRIVEIAAERIGVRPKAAYVIRWKAANALAFPLVQRIAVTDTALAQLADDELVAICVHELGHLNESRRMKGLRIAGAFVWLPLVCIKPIMGTWGNPGLMVLGLFVFFGHHAVRRFTRSMEERADAISRAHEGEPGTYARALERLYEVNLIPAVMRQKRGTHPHLYDRLLAAQITPAYPRPKPPAFWRPWIAILAMAVTALLYILMTGALFSAVLR